MIKDTLTSIENGADTDLQYFNHWLLADLPQINDAVLNKRCELSVLSDQVSELVARMPDHTHFNERTAREAMLYLGFAISSVERHSQDRGVEAGVALRALNPHMEDMLVNLGRIGGHSPRDTVYTFALWNNPNSVITFTGDRQEQLFIDIVAQSFSFVEDAADKIHTILHDGKVSEASNIALLSEAGDDIENMRKQYLRYMERMPDGSQALTADFFLNVFRQYNCNFPVNGEMWGAPTAANSHSHWLIDLMIQPVEPGYREHIMSRTRYLTTEDKAKIKFAASHDGILEKLAREFNVAPAVLVSLDGEAFSEFAATLSQEDQVALVAVGKLMDTYAKASAMHWTLISNYMIKPLNMRINTATTVAADRGTSGLTLDEVQHIRDDRFNNPFLVNIKRLRAMSAHR
jgi:hypothetical protein